MIKPLDKNDCLSVSGGFIVVIDDEINPTIKYLVVYNDLTGDVIKKFAFNSRSKQEFETAVSAAEKIESLLYDKAEQNSVNPMLSLGF